MALVTLMVSTLSKAMKVLLGAVFSRCAGDEGVGLTGGDVASRRSLKNEDYEDHRRQYPTLNHCLACRQGTCIPSNSVPSLSLRGAILYHTPVQLARSSHTDLGTKAGTMPFAMFVSYQLHD